MAKNEEKMISVEKMDEIIEERFPGFSVVNYYGQELIVKHTVPFDIFSGIVQHVIDACFGGDTGEYIPANLDFAIRLCIMGAYTNVRMPQNIEKQYRMLYGTDLYNAVIREIDDDQWEAMFEAIHDGIDVRNDTNRVMFERGMQAVSDQIGQIGQNLQSLFSGVSSDDLQKLVGAIGENGIDEEKLVQAVVTEQNKAREEIAEADADGE